MTVIKMIKICHP